VWSFFGAHPWVFVVSLALLLAFVLVLVLLLLCNCDWFRIGPMGVEAVRAGSGIPRPPGLLEGAGKARRSPNGRMNEPDPARKSSVDRVPLEKSSPLLEGI
jgi:hypothetical protein